jgi:hypothetical protein
LSLIGGIINDHRDGSLEDWLFHRGVCWSICTETPGRLPLAVRVKANCDIILCVLDYLRQMA